MTEIQVVKKPVTFQQEHHAAFDSKQSSQTITFVLGKPDRPFILTTDASGRAIGAVLEQFEEETSVIATAEQLNTLRKIPVAFVSGKFIPNHVNCFPR